MNLNEIKNMLDQSDKDHHNDKRSHRDCHGHGEDDCDKDCHRHEGQHCDKNCHYKNSGNCICRILPDLVKAHKTLRLRTKTADEIIGTIKCFDKCTGCIIIIQPEMKSPKLPAVAVIISCGDIESISFEVKNKCY
ncbi:hypothetical protein [Bacillus massilinigeriensis]|uniref:hypothetical protein n=1 Tax=Bacillus mediterraneensis TaxID=1805474 RepID=UPI0008F815E5|nr:hypothetical protein [Bacillus mediterraneensis]